MVSVLCARVASVGLLMLCDWNHWPASVDAVDDSPDRRGKYHPAVLLDFAVGDGPDESIVALGFLDPTDPPSLVYGIARAVDRQILVREPSVQREAHDRLHLAAARLAFRLCEIHPLTIHSPQWEVVRVV